MDVSRMLSNGAVDPAGTPESRRQNHQYPTRHGATMPDETSMVKPYSPSVQRPPRANGVAAAGSGYARASPAKKGQKHIVFQLIDPEDPRIQARLPMRVMISQNDNTESIVTTVKNFYGLYEFGVSFETKDGISIVAAYDNFDNDMIVYVRTVAPPPTAVLDNVRDSASPKKPSLGAPFEMRPTLSHATLSPSRTAARSAGARSLSPQSEYGRRSASAAPGSKAGRPQRTKSKDNSVYGDGDGYSSGDNGGGSVASSRRSKVEQVNAEISVENIVEGGRRKRAFESSELPLFVPPQVPMSASISSISPQRRAGPPNIASPYTSSYQQTFSYPQPLPSPQSYVSGANYLQTAMSGNGINISYQHPGNRQLRGRPNGVGYPPSRASVPGILATPDPTVGSAISDEDVALQLMRLGDPMAFSHGRTSTSTVDDALSGKADAASSDEEEGGDDEEEDLPMTSHYAQEDAGPQRKKPRLGNELPSDPTSGEEYEDQFDGTFTGSEDGNGNRKLHKSKLGRPRSNTSGMDGVGKMGKPRTNSMMKPKSKTSVTSKIPMSPSSMPAPSRKASIASTINFQHQLGTDEEDLSSKPRCQRCRKSKKGCDRQRPCGRCKDAGIGIEGCLSEDEGNGRKGRYGRHMGVTIKKAEEGFDEEMSPPSITAPANGFFLAPALPDKSKKRKRSNP